MLLVQNLMLAAETTLSDWLFLKTKYKQINNSMYLKSYKNICESLGDLVSVRKLYSLLVIFAVTETRKTFILVR